VPVKKGIIGKWYRSERLQLPTSQAQYGLSGVMQQDSFVDFGAG